MLLCFLLMVKIVLITMLYFLLIGAYRDKDLFASHTALPMIRLGVSKKSGGNTDKTADPN